MKPDLSLTTEQRQLLCELVRTRPNLTSGQLRLIFERRTGRLIAPSTAKRAKRGHYEEGVYDRHRLTDGQRETLRMLILENGPEYYWREVARIFEATTGRPISSWGVSLFAAKELGIVGPLRPGTKPGITARTICGKLEAAREKKLARAPYRPGYLRPGPEFHGEEEE